MNGVSRFAGDLVQDLRDRRLLIPAIALLAAIVAVPLLLGGDSGDSGGTGATAPAVTTAPGSIAGAAQVDPVVLADVPGLRDYRKRLDGRNGRNPFVQQGDDSSGSGGGNGGSGSGGGSASSTDSSSTASSTSSSTGTDSGGSTSGGSSGGSNGGSAEVQWRLIKYTIDVRTGPAGDTEVLKDVDPLSLLPGKKQPVVQYISSDSKARKAGFVVSPSVLSSQGDGNCAPGRDDCQYLSMKVGDLEKFEYGDKPETYRLELLAIHRKLVPLPDGAG